MFVKCRRLALQEGGSEVTEMNGLPGERLEVTIRTTISASEMCVAECTVSRELTTTTASCTCTHFGPQFSSLKQDGLDFQKLKEDD